MQDSLDVLDAEGGFVADCSIWEVAGGEGRELARDEDSQGGGYCLGLGGKEEVSVEGWRDGSVRGGKGESCEGWHTYGPATGGLDQR